MDRLADLLLEWEERQSRGDPAGPDELCPDDPALASRLAEQVRMLQACDRLLGFGPPAPPADPPLPDRIGKYEIRCFLGGGGMGWVYHGWDPALNRPAAVKVIRPNLPGEAPAVRLAARFRREGRLLAGLKHPNIVAVYDAGVQDGRPYLAMEFVPGGTLADRRAMLTAAGPAAIAPVVEKVARAVQAAHDRGVLHRDLKPGNILMSADDEPLVADFGLAKLLTPDDPPSTAGEDTPPGPAAAEATLTAGPQPGTPGYMAPEQADPLGSAAPTADVYALGVILHELLTGTRPFPATGRVGPAPPVTGPTPAHRRLGAVAARCLEADAGRRYASAGAVADAVRRAARPPRRWRWAAAVAALAAAVGLTVWLKLLGPAAEAVAPEPPEFAGYTNPAAVREALAKLDRDGSLDLVAGAAPAGYRVGPGLPAGRVYLDPQHGWTVQAGEQCFVELLPRLPAGRWRVEAELRHERFVSDVSVVGMAVGMSQAAVGGTPSVRGYVLTYSEVEPTAPAADGGVLASTLVSRMEEPKVVPLPLKEIFVHNPRPLPVPRGADGPRVRTLTATLTPESAAFDLDGLPFTPCPLQTFREACPHPGGPDGSFMDGVGVYARHAILRVHRLTVRRLDR
jgi:hypothetical protein